MDYTQERKGIVFVSQWLPMTLNSPDSVSPDQELRSSGETEMDEIWGPLEEDKLVL